MFIEVLYNYAYMKRTKFLNEEKRFEEEILFRVAVKILKRPKRMIFFDTESIPFDANVFDLFEKVCLGFLNSYNITCFYMMYTFRHKHRVLDSLFICNGYGISEVLNDFFYKYSSKFEDNSQ